jgi:hypothetical protein
MGFLPANDVGFLVIFPPILRFASPFLQPALSRRSRELAFAAL